MLRYFTALVIMLFACSVSIGYAKDQDAMPATKLHELITQHKGWLNTSRPLVASDLKGRIVLLDFWTYCCINCLQVMPDLAYLEEKFGDELTVIGVHSAKFNNEKDDENIRQAILRHHLTHPVVNDFDFKTWNAFGIRAWPTFVLLNPMGIIEEVYSGEGKRAAIERDIQALRVKYAGKITTAKLPIALEKDKTPATYLSFPTKLAAGRYGETEQALYIADSGHERIVVTSLKGDVLTTIGSGEAGLVDGDFATARFHRPQGLLLDYPNLYVADTANHALRLVNLEKGQVTTLAGTGRQGHEYGVRKQPALEASMASPWDLAFYPDKQHITVAQAGLHQLWSYDLQAKTVSAIAGNGHESIEDGANPINSLSQPSGLSALADTLYFVDAETSSLRRLQGGEVKTLIGTGLFDFGYKEGTHDVALMQHPLGLVATESGIWVADAYNHSIRRFDVTSGVLSNDIGHGERGHKDGAFASATFNEPNAIIEVGEKFYIADTNNNAIRIADRNTKTVSTLIITPPKVVSTVTFSEGLPNLETMPPVQLKAGTEATVAIGLQKGWHINEDAPSFLAVFDAKDTSKSAASLDTKALRLPKILLPALTAGKYRLQTTLYYCKDAKGSQCLLKSFDVPVNVQQEALSTIELKLN